VQWATVVAMLAVPSLVGAEAPVPGRPSAEVNAYLEYRKEGPKAKRLEDLYSYFDSKSVEFYRSLGANDRTTIFGQLKAQVELFPELTVVQEERDTSAVRVLFSAKAVDNKEAVVMVEILREGPMLKVGQATWKVAE
jgi:hypothetical protein